MKKRIITAITGIALLLSCTGTGTVFAAENTQLSLQDVEKIAGVVIKDGKVRYEMEDESLLTPSSSVEKRSASSLPKVFSLKDKIPAVRNQGSANNCWAYGALASLESNLIMTGRADASIDLSENHLTWFAYNGKNSASKSKYAGNDTYKASNPYAEGGNRWYSTATLARWYGAVNQSRANSASSLASSLRTVSDYRLKNADFLPDPKTASGRTAIKQTLMEKGLVDVSYYESSYNYTKVDGKTCYYTSLGSAYANHEVAIAGWDDTIEINGKKGAWLIRNSWGTGKQDQGYFYLSYYDKSICDATCFEAEPVNKEYTSIYQYDGVGPGDADFTSTEKVYGANRYTARQDELLKAVGTYTGAANSTVTVTIYVSSLASSPASGVKVYSKSFAVPYAGYHTLDLGKTIGIPKGYTFSVSVTSSYVDKDTGKRRYVLPVEVKNLSYNECSLDYSKNQSYLHTEKGWIDVTKAGRLKSGSLYEVGNAMAKAYAVSSGTEIQSVSVPKTNYTKTYGNSSFNLNAKRTAGSGKLYYKTSSSSVATVSSSGKVTIKGPGKATLTVAAAPTAAYKSEAKTISLTVKPKKSTISSVKSSKYRNLTVKWKKDSKASGYQVVAAKNKSFTSGKKTAVISKNSTVSKTFKDLSSNKTYYVKVRAYKTVDGKKLYGSYSKIKTCKTR